MTNGTYQIYSSRSDTLDPEWVTRIDVDYFENEDDECRMEVYNWNKNYTDLKKHDFLGIGLIFRLPWFVI